MTSFRFYPIFTNWDIAKKDNYFGPFYAIPVTNLLNRDEDKKEKMHAVSLQKELKSKSRTSNPGPGLTMTGAIVAKWLIENKGNHKFWYRINNENPMLIVDDLDFSNKFRNWYEKQSITQKSSFFKGKNDFLNSVSKSGSLAIEGKVEFPMPEFTKNGSLDQKSFKVWCWMIDSIKNQYWYWDNAFFFQRHEDAVLFKLKFYGETEPKVA